jgi:hypothetical protein
MIGVMVGIEVTVGVGGIVSGIEVGIGVLVGVGGVSVGVGAGGGGSMTSKL